ncbi:L-2-hydroxyglutarate oxidase [Scopulibacillus darangshiensis]|uniref:L-2-hydroxyglutarate oxidase n=1 Tax=Scopulibacillus darangshiensis TaxID=442528 RepID=A0A4R2NHF4_9BACL|nr:L-2-hydroxyglutarate oxidase [Scopulibacillus darangshiensis]TCP20652.1 L-2-hydroxyglutarate oxidase [Scopulibacillus darangshiensis]
MYDYVVIGAGIVGLSTANRLTEIFPKAKIAVIEKENRVACHQTGHNSGVIHSGIYYKPGSLKASFAQRGGDAIEAFCTKHDIPVERCGKVIVATQSKELEELEKLYQRGRQNNLRVEKMTANQINEIEPHVQSIGGIYVPSTGIVDFSEVSRRLADLLISKNQDLLLGTMLTSANYTSDAVELKTAKGTLQSKYVINCSGLNSDKVAHLFGIKVDMTIVPFKGEYYELAREKRFLVNHLIYPVPNPDFPFLGVHFTRMMGGAVHVGPNAIPSFKREGYKKFSFNSRDAFEILGNKSFWKIAMENKKEGLTEMMRSLSKRAFLKNVQRYIPEIKREDLIPAEPGVRAQALSDKGKLIDDFFIARTDRVVHVCNAPSPAATAALEIGKYIVDSIK